MLNEKEFNKNLDLGRLCVFDNNPFNNEDYVEEVIMERSKKNLDLIFSGLYKLKTTQHGTEDENKDFDKPATAVKLPGYSTILPRGKSCPKTSKFMTKWEEFAKDKGIFKKKAPRMVYSEKLGEYLPRWGKDSIKQKERDADYIIEDKPKYEGKNPFTVQKQELKLKQMENVKKSNDNRDRFLNKKREKDSKLKGNISDHKKKLDVAQRSTASQGRFDKKLKNETPVNPLKKPKIRHDFFQTSNEEKQRNNKILAKIIGKTGGD